MRVINETRLAQVRRKHPNMVSGIDVAIRAMEELRPPERSLAASFDGMTTEEVEALPIRVILPNWVHLLTWQFKISTIGELLDLGWPPILALDGVGRGALWEMRDGLLSAGLDWRHLVVDGIKHPARRKKHVPLGA